MGASTQRQRVMRSGILFLIVILASLVTATLWPPVTQASQTSSTSLLKVQLKWLDQAQFAGFYVATDQGFFARRNLVVRTMPGSASSKRTLRAS